MDKFIQPPGHTPSSRRNSFSGKSSQEIQSRTQNPLARRKSLDIRPLEVNRQLQNEIQDHENSIKNIKRLMELFTSLKSDLLKTYKTEDQVFNIINESKAYKQKKQKIESLLNLGNSNEKDKEKNNHESEMFTMAQGLFNELQEKPLDFSTKQLLKSNKEKTEERLNDFNAIQKYLSEYEGRKKQNMDKNKQVLDKLQKLKTIDDPTANKPDFYSYDKLIAHLDTDIKDAAQMIIRDNGKEIGQNFYDFIMQPVKDNNTSSQNDKLTYPTAINKMYDLLHSEERDLGDRLQALMVMMDLDKRLEGFFKVMKNFQSKEVHGFLQYIWNKHQEIFKSDKNKQRCEQLDKYQSQIIEGLKSIGVNISAEQKLLSEREFNDAISSVSDQVSNKKEQLAKEITASKRHLELFSQQKAKEQTTMRTAEITNEQGLAERITQDALAAIAQMITLKPLGVEFSKEAEIASPASQIAKEVELSKGEDTDRAATQEQEANLGDKIQRYTREINELNARIDQLKKTQQLCSKWKGLRKHMITDHDKKQLYADLEVTNDYINPFLKKMNEKVFTDNNDTIKVLLDKNNSMTIDLDLLEIPKAAETLFDKVRKVDNLELCDKNLRSQFIKDHSKGKQVLNKHIEDSQEYLSTIYNIESILSNAHNELANPAQNPAIDTAIDVFNGLKDNNKEHVYHNVLDRLIDSTIINDAIRLIQDDLPQDNSAKIKANEKYRYHIDGLNTLKIFSKDKLQEIGCLNLIVELAEKHRKLVTPLARSEIAEATARLQTKWTQFQEVFKISELKKLYNEQWKSENDNLRDAMNNTITSLDAITGSKFAEEAEVNPTQIKNAITRALEQTQKQREVVQKQLDQLVPQKATLEQANTPAQLDRSPSHSQEPVAPKVLTKDESTVAPDSTTSSSQLTKKAKLTTIDSIVSNSVSYTSPSKGVPQTIDTKKPIKDVKPSNTSFVSPDHTSSTLASKDVPRPTDAASTSDSRSQSDSQQARILSLIKGAEEEISTLEKNILKLTKDSTAKDVKINKSVQLLQDAKSKLDQKNKEIENLNLNLNELNEQKKELEKKLENAQKIIFNLKNVNGILSGFDTKKNARNNKIIETNKLLTNHNKELAEQIQSLNADKAALATQTQQLAREILDLHASIENLSSLYEDNHKLYEDNRKLTADIADLGKENHDLKDVNSNLSEYNGDITLQLQEATEVFENKIEELNKQIALLERAKNVEMYQDQVAKTKIREAQLAAFTEDPNLISNMGRQIEDKDAEIERLQRTIDQLRQNSTNQQNLPSFYISPAEAGYNFDPATAIPNPYQYNPSNLNEYE